MDAVEEHGADHHRTERAVTMHTQGFAEAAAKKSKVGGIVFILARPVVCTWRTCVDVVINGVPVRRAGDGERHALVREFRHGFTGMEENLVHRCSSRWRIESVTMYSIPALWSTRMTFLSSSCCDIYRGVPDIFS